MRHDREISDFIKACKKINPNIDTDSCYRAFKVVQGNLKIRIDKEMKSE